MSDETETKSSRPESAAEFVARWRQRKATPPPDPTPTEPPEGETAIERLARERRDIARADRAAGKIGASRGPSVETVLAAEAERQALARQAAEAERQRRLEAARKRGVGKL
jgi:hypothetical protein